MKPWENYQSAPEQTEGPWSQYAQATPETEQPAEPQQSQMSRGEAAFHTMTNPLGFGDEIKAGISAMTAKLLGGRVTKDVDIGDLYKEARDHQRSKLEQARTQYPVQSFAGQMFSDIGVAGKLLKGVGLAGEGFGTAVKGGATLGGSSALGEAQDITDIPQTLKDVAKGTLGGAAIGGGVNKLLPGAISAVGAISRAPKAILQKIVGITPKSQETLQAFEAAGVSPTLANIAEGQTSKTFQNLLGNFPGSRGVIERSTQNQVDDITKQIANITDSPGGTIQQAGKKIKEGAVTLKEGLKQRIGQNYDKLDEFIPKTEDGQVAKIPTNNLKSLSQDPEIQDVIAVGAGDTAKVVKHYANIIDESGNIPYDRLKIFRSTVGRKLESPSLLGDERGALKKIYGALSEDMKSAVVEKGGEKGLQVFNKANNAFSRYQGAIESKINPLIEAKTPYKVYDLVLSGTKQGGTDARLIMKALDPEQQNFVRGTIAREMGLANEGMQGAERKVFSPDKFLTEYNKMQKIGAEKDLFTATQNESLKNLNKAIEAIKDTSKARQSSNNLPYAAWIGLGSLSLANLPAGVSAVGGANITAKMLTNPAFINWLARAPKIKPAGIPIHLSQLSKIAAANPDIRDATLDYLQSITIGNKEAQAEEPKFTEGEIRQQLMQQRYEHPSLMEGDNIDEEAKQIKHRYYR